MTKIACLEEYGFKAGESGNVDTQWKAGESGNADTQWAPGTSGSKEKQWALGTSSSKETQWVFCGRFGEKGNEQTYASLTAFWTRPIRHEQSLESR